ncbi:uncharacterized protein LOC131231890 isoform X2 [Magnolia sinica]|uniref:uncharacterized protein LOC131231890 isoform X2 n=1 Tax=Magnolia sinica TaxID=86752 RepID=UPI002657B4D5|nr:uncharacterized protein LOC131231890 isoform X2 [Magnolia sinica]
MANQSMKRLFLHFGRCKNIIRKQESYRQFISGILTRFRTQSSKAEKAGADDSREGKDGSQGSTKPKQNEQRNQSSGLAKYSSDDDDLSETKWRLELAWLTKVLEPALQMCKRALATGDDNQKIPPSSRSFAEILASLQRSKIDIKDWSLSDLTAVLYLIYLHQASEDKIEDVKGVQISSDHIGFRLRLVGHSLGGAAAALLAILLRKRSEKELGFSPDIVSAIGFGTPPCVSKELAENCASYVSTVVLQDDIIPRLSAASLARLRNEILQTDWMSVLEGEDWKRFLELVTNAKQVVSSVQDVARKLADYANFRTKTNASGLSRKELAAGRDALSKPPTDTTLVAKEELFTPGTQYYLQRKVDAGGVSIIGRESYTYTLWKRHPGEHFQRIVLSSNLISDHKCDNHYYALRDVLKGIPKSADSSFCRW